MHLTARLIHALPIEERRVLNRKEAASYAGVSPGHFAKLVDLGTMPGPLSSYGSARRWDKSALDRALNTAGGIADLGKTADVSAYDLWSQSHADG